MFRRFLSLLSHKNCNTDPERFLRERSRQETVLNKQAKIHIPSIFPSFDYSVHLNLCSDTAVLSGIKLVAGIHVCMSVFFYGAWTGRFDRFKLTCFSFMILSH